MRYAATLAFVVLFVVGSGVATLVPAGLAAESETAEPPADSQPEPTPEQWNRTFGGDGDDMIADVTKTPDGGYVLAGWTAASGTRDGWVVKIDADGERQWERTFEGPGTDRLYAVESARGGYVLAGRTDRGGSPQGWVLTLASDGSTRDERTLGTGAFHAMTRDGGSVVLAGWTRAGGNVGGWGVKLGTDGVAWERRYPAPDGYSTGRLKAVVSAPDGGFFFGGEAESDNADAWVMRIEASGESRWNRTHGSPARESVWAATGGDGGIVLAGESWENDDRDGWVLRYESDGSRSWERRYGGPEDDWLDSATRTDDGYVFTGGTLTGGIGGADGLVVGTGADGEEQWRKVVGSESWDKPWPAIESHDGGYLLAGQTAGFGANGKDGWVLHLGASGESNATATTTQETTDSPTSARDSTTTAATADEQAGVGRTALLGLAGVGLLSVLVWRVLSRR